MILQRDKKVCVWGTCAPAEKITIEIQGKKAQTAGSAGGDWKAYLEPLCASENEQMTVRTDRECRILHRIAIGEVWLAGGQSNMEFQMRYECHRELAKQDCPNHRLRFYDVPEVCFDGQLEQFDYSRMGIWRSAKREEVEYFSAVGYYFQRALEEQLNVPVGIIGCNWGGTTASAWMSADSVRRAGYPWIEEYDNKVKGMDWEAYWERQAENPMNDRGNPFADAFTELVCPNTVTPEEVEACLGPEYRQMSADSDEMMANAVPGCLYEHMLKKAAPFTIRGFLWYQGESDDVPGRQKMYADMLEALIGDWRKLWQEELPFMIVQLPGWESWLGSCCIDFDTIRKCQEQVANTVPQVYLCSISDAGEQLDIHPKDKRIVGRRLALLARGHVYGQRLLCDAPVAEKIQAEQDQVTVYFRNAGGGLKIVGGKLSAMQVLADGKEIAYRAYIDHDKLILQLPQSVKGGIEIKFAQGAWYRVNLYNDADIPSIPFVLQI